MGNSMIYRTNRTYLLSGVLLYLLLLAYWGSSIGDYAIYNIVNVIVFCSYIFVLWNVSGKVDEYYTEFRLASTVFVYSSIFVTLYLFLSDYYTGNTFVFSESDARVYEKTSFAIKDMTLSNAINHIVQTRGWSVEDWGAPLSMGFILKIIPSKFFLNFVYILLNTLGSLFLFRIGKYIMSKQYAFIAVLVYAISSYSMFFMSVFLKEQIMVFLVVASIYLLYKYWESRRYGFLILCGIVSLSLLLFRPAIACFVWISCIVSFFSTTKSNVLRIFFILAVVVGLGLIYTSMMQSAERFVNANQYVNQTYTQATKWVVYLGGLVGPFPAMLQPQDLLTNKPLFGSGLLYKFLLVYPFWRGFLYCIRMRSSEVYPLFIFVIAEILSLYFVLDTLELRKSMPHIPLFIMAAFWFMDKHDNDMVEEIQSTSLGVRIKTEYSICVCLVFVMTLIWNTLK